MLIVVDESVSDHWASHDSGLVDYILVLHGWKLRMTHGVAR